MLETTSAHVPINGEPAIRVIKYHDGADGYNVLIGYVKY